MKVGTEVELVCSTFRRRKHLGDGELTEEGEALSEGFHEGRRVDRVRSKLRVNRSSKTQSGKKAREMNAITLARPTRSH